MLELVPFVGLAATVALGSVAGPLGAQRDTTCPPVSGNIFLSCQVDVPAKPLPTRRTPPYPPVLRTAGVSGIVHVAYVVDSTGRVDIGSLEVVQSTNGLFRSAVQGALQGMRFEPARRAGHSVSAWYEEKFQYVANEPPAPPTLPDTVFTRIDPADGVPLTVTEQTPHGPTGDSTFSETDLLGAERAAVGAVAAAVPPAPAAPQGATLCVSVRVGTRALAADDDLLRQLTIPGRPAVTPHDCPFTYNVPWFYPLDSVGNKMAPPPGWVDPYALSVEQLRMWTRDILVVDVHLNQGGATNNIRCAVRRVAGGWTAACASLGVSVS